jgi:two-component system, LytTR family, response regulator
MADRVLRVMIVDDEPLGRRRIEELLRAHEDVEIVGQFGDGASAVAAIRALNPDLVFLDVQMPGMTGLEVVEQLGGAMPATIFVTAFDRHAVEAFDLAAVDYLVKPFDDDRFEQALNRARRTIDLHAAEALRARLLEVLHRAEPSGRDHVAAAKPSYVERIPVESRGEVRFIPVSEIDAITASGAYAELVVGEKRYLIRETMQELEERLDPAKFLRIHRSSIVAVHRVEALLRGAGGDYEIKLKNGARLSVARSRRAEVEARLGMTP